MSVRAATARDRYALETLCAALLAEHQARFPGTYPALEPATSAAIYAAEWAQRLDADPKCLVWLAADREPVGFLAGEVWTRSTGQPTAVFFAEWLYVVPAHRHRGVALALIRALIEACRRENLTHVECLTVVGDRQWERRGWRPTAVRYMRPLGALAADVARAAAGQPPPQEGAP